MTSTIINLPKILNNSQFGKSKFNKLQISLSQMYRSYNKNKQHYTQIDQQIMQKINQNSPERGKSMSLRNFNFSTYDCSRIFLMDQKSSPKSNQIREISSFQRAKSEITKRTVPKIIKQSKWKKVMERNELCHQLATKKLMHKDIVRLSQLIHRQATNLKSIRSILNKFQQQIQNKIKCENPQKSEKPRKQDKKQQFIRNFTIRIKSRPPQNISFHSKTKQIKAGNQTQQNKKIFQDVKRSSIFSGIKKKKQFKINSDVSTVFQNKLYKYLQFLLLINLTNRIYRNLDQNNLKTYKYWVGYGNNSSLIQMLMKKRSWWQQSSKEQSDFFWSQLKIKKIHDKQNQTHKQLKRFRAQSALERKITNNSEDKVVLKIMDHHDWCHIKKTLSSRQGRFNQRVSMFGKTILKQDPLQQKLVTNHLPYNQILGNKKALFLALRLYYQLIQRDLKQIVPQTYHIKSLEDEEFTKFCEAFQNNKSKIWIIKPGQFSNRGQGISVSSSLSEISSIINSKVCADQRKTYIVQHYINAPYLYNHRKFDIRAYMLLTTNNGILKGYWYDQGYIRTSSETFDLNNLDSTFTHLTNDAIQKHSKKYGKYEEGNKLSYADFQRYLVNINSKHNLYTQVLPKMKKIAVDSLKATSLLLNKDRHEHNFQVFGLDFMITSKFDVLLIEINTNPCLETGCSVLGRIIPTMLQNAFRIGLDPIFPPPHHINSNKHFISQNAIFFNNFELIFDQIKQRHALHILYQNHMPQLLQIGCMDDSKMESQVQEQRPETSYVQETIKVMQQTF